MSLPPIPNVAKHGSTDGRRRSPEIAREEIAYCERIPPFNDQYRANRQRWLGLKEGMDHEDVLNLVRATGTQMGTPQRVSAPAGTNRFVLRGQMWPESVDQVGATKWKMLFENGRLVEWTNLPEHPCDKGVRREIGG